MPWNNDRDEALALIVYHGCDGNSANSIAGGSVDLAHCKTFTDFGKGFYTTTNLRQAKNWANARCRMLAAAAKRAAKRAGAPPPPPPTFVASIVRFEIDRAQLSKLEDLCFVWENAYPSDYWELISWCRTPPQRWHYGSNKYYDTVYGPVSLWPQTLVIKDCDQISFHTDAAITLLNGSSRTVSEQVQNSAPTFPLFPP
jgi:hypothetical protein